MAGTSDGAAAEEGDGVGRAGKGSTGNGGPSEGVAEGVDADDEADGGGAVPGGV